MDNHPKFLSNLEDSEQYRWLIAKWLSDRGHIVRVPPMQLAETRRDWKSCADSGDLEICLRVEVKRISRDFTCREDWPFGLRFIVCARHAFDRSAPKPYGFVIVSESARHAAIVMSSSRSSWTVETIKDRRYDESQEFYLAPMERVLFVDLSDGVE